MSARRTRPAACYTPVPPLGLACACLALGTLACAPERSTTEPTGVTGPELAAGRTYAAVDLGTLGSPLSGALGINARGQVVGYSDTPNGTHAFLWEKGEMTDLGTMGGNFSRAFAINPDGQVVGGSSRTDGDDHAFLWENGHFTDLGTLGGSFSEAFAINPSGEVVGQSLTRDGETHGFLWSSGVMTDLGALGGTFSQAWGINPAGEVVGRFLPAGGEPEGEAPPDYHAFLWSRGIMTDLGTLGGNRAEAYAINPAGEVVGASTTAGGQPHVFHVFQWAKGVMTDLGIDGAAFGISLRGEVVGTSASRAFYWWRGAVTFLPAVGGMFGQAFAINPAGTIVGESETEGGDIHATLWTRK